MKIIKSFNEWCDEALLLLKNSSFCYISSFNLNYTESLNDKVYEILQESIKIKHSILIGLNNMQCKQNCEHCLINNQTKYNNILKLKNLTNNYRIVQELHMKVFITSNGVIIGGMNITKSGWIDRSFTYKDKKIINELSIDFKEQYLIAKDYILTDYIDTSKIFTFGKYKGKLIEEVKKNNPDYIIWLKNNTTHINI